MNRLRTDFIETFVVELAVLGAGLYLYRAASLQLGESGFAEYALARRVISLLQPLVVLGMDVGLVRFVAMSMGNTEQIARQVATAALAMGMATALVLGGLVLFPAPMAGLFFGTRTSAYLMGPLMWMVVGAALHPLAYSYLRGRSRGRPANVLQVFALAIAPLVAISLAGGETYRALAGIGIGWVVVSVVALLLSRPPVGTSADRGFSAPLMRYGLSRFPGDLVQVALFSVPPILVAHAVDQTTAAVFAFGVSVVTLIGSMFVPIGNVLLPAASRLVKEGRTGELRRYTLRILVLAGAVGIGGVAAAVVLAPWIIHDYLALSVPGAVHELRMVVGAAIPFTIYMAARRVVDAVHEAPVNAVNLGVSFGVFLLGAAAGYAGGNGATAVRLSFVAACAVLAGLTLRSVHRSLAR